MPKAVSSFELTLNQRSQHQTLASWLYGELRSAILEGRLESGSRLPASRDFARQYGLSRGTVVSVLERLQAEGYVSCRVGSGTWVNRVQTVRPIRKPESTPPAYVRRVISGYARPKPLADIVATHGIRPFSMRDPDVTLFPSETWGSIAARRSRNFRQWLEKTEDDGRGYRPLREAIASYLASSRGVRCHADQVIVVSGVQQALDLLSRLLLKPGEPVWMEDPGYFGALIAFGNVRARIVPVSVDGQGLSVSAGLKACPDAKGAYVTPAHQFPLGMTMSLERRMALLNWASRQGAFLIEDDYDSEYRFAGQPVPALQSLDRNSNVILIGSFSKLLFPSLRIGYVVLPSSLADYFLAFRFRTDFRNLNLDQAVLCEFITDGHLARHLRRMREIYASRLMALIEGSKEYLDGLLELSNVRAGLYTAGFLKNGMSSREGEQAALEHNVEAFALDRYRLRGPDPNGLLLGFAAFDKATIRAGLVRLAAALGRRRARN